MAVSAETRMTNAATLIRDPAFRDWVQVQMIFQARDVIANNSAAELNLAAERVWRLWLANLVISSPTVYLEEFVRMLATDNAISGAGDHVATDTDPTGVTAGSVVNKTGAIWSAFARARMPAATP